jgi:hypothetical protein
VKDQVSHPYKTTDRISVLYILTFTFLDTRQEDKLLRTEWQQAFPNFVCSYPDLLHFLNTALDFFVIIDAQFANYTDVRVRE